MKKIALVIGLLLATPAFAADNAVIVTPGVGVTMKSKDIGAGVQAMQPILSDASGNTLLTTSGADAVSNTLTGIPTYDRMLIFNGTTWDRWQGNIKAASGSFASGAFASGALASGSVASGAVASGAVAAGALAAGAGVDGWDLTQGAIADAAVTAGATGSVSAKLRAISRDMGTVATNSALPLPVQTGIGNVNIGAVQSAGSAYETVAASQTAQVLGATGATGDYLSHCVIYPTSTSPGVVTVFDNTNAAGTNVIAFAGGASSTSNLTPISVPVGAISASGAWKVTTGAAVSVTCYGKFT